MFDLLAANVGYHRKKKAERGTSSALFCSSEFALLGVLLFIAVSTYYR